MATDFISYNRVSAFRIMWVLVMFDLPTETKRQRKDATDFRKRLLQDGFVMFQYSIYVRNCPSIENAQVHINRVQKIVPDEGKVCIVKITEKQFNDIILFEGCKKAPPMQVTVQLELF